MCPRCPFNLEREAEPLTASEVEYIEAAQRRGEEWVCHATCERGIVVTERSLRCAGDAQGRAIRRLTEGG